MRGSRNRAVSTCYVDVERVAGAIADVQKPSGEIPWHADGKTDAWDHVEAAMGLATGGYLDESARAYRWLAESRLAEGGWYSAYRNGIPEDRTRESHMAAYMAVGVFHHYLITEDLSFIRRMWPAVVGAIDFALSLQAPGGEIYWAVSPAGDIDPMALLTASSSVHMSLKCALALAALVGEKRPEWRSGLDRLQRAIARKPHRFNMTKSRFSMDWFYPVLGGAVTGQEARTRIERHWRKFVVKDQGVRCVSDHPWITMAETAELVLALNAMGRRVPAQILFSWIHDKTYRDGTYWCGHTFPDMTIWPEERMTWTNGVVLMAADALYRLTPAHQLFEHRFWKDRESDLRP